MARLKAAEFDERLTLVEHLDELRTRIIICIAAVVITCGLCFWQNHHLIHIVNAPLPDGFKPLTLSPAEPFLTTFKLSMYAGLILALPLLLYQAYAFILPALSPAERRTIVPFLLMVPFLFVAGVVFGYYVVLPAALKFLLNFNDTVFNNQIRASEYYGFVTLTLLAMGLVFQVPMGILAVVRLGIVSIEQLRKNRRYAYLILAIIAMLLPGTDPITMLIELVPLLLLYEISIVLARFFGEPLAVLEEEAKDAMGEDPEDDT
jgi:sec-independent protein translocase protein TatC